MTTLIKEKLKNSDKQTIIDNYRIDAHKKITRISIISQQNLIPSNFNIPTMQSHIHNMQTDGQT